MCSAFFMFKKIVFHTLFCFCKNDSGIVGKDVYVGPTGKLKPCAGVCEPPNLYIGFCSDHCPGTVNIVFVYVSRIRHVVCSKVSFATTIACYIQYFNLVLYTCGSDGSLIILSY